MTKGMQKARRALLQEASKKKTPKGSRVLLGKCFFFLLIIYISDLKDVVVLMFFAGIIFCRVLWFYFISWMALRPGLKVVFHGFSNRLQWGVRCFIIVPFISFRSCC